MTSALASKYCPMVCPQKIQWPGFSISCSSFKVGGKEYLQPTTDTKRGCHEMNHIKNIRNSFGESTRTGGGKDSTRTRSFWQKRQKGTACTLKCYRHHLFYYLYSSAASPWGRCFSIYAAISVRNRWERTLSDLSVRTEHGPLGLHQKE